MTKAKLIYLGKDNAFDAALAEAAKAASLSYQVGSPDWLAEATNRNVPVIFVGDADNTEFLALADRPEGGNSPGVVLKVLAIANSQAAPSAGGDFADILTKDLHRELLAKRIRFYLRILRELQNRQEPDDQAKENERLRQQLQGLQAELGRVDSDLDIRTKTIDKINHISDLSHQINCLNLDQIASVCIEAIPKLIAARYASLYTFESEQEVLHLLRQNHTYAINRLVELKENPASPMTVAIREKRLMLIKDFSAHEVGDVNDKVAKMDRGFAQNYRSNSCIVAPLVSGGNVLGVLNLADKMEAECFDEVSDLPPIQLLCEILGSAMSNIKLYEEVCQQARSDGMTGLLNHRSFYDELSKEVQRVQRYGGNLSLIMLDLDDLKTVNDRYGHLVGDRILVFVAEQLRRSIRNTDVAARYGGDEFAVILPNTNLAHAVIVAQRTVDMVSGGSVQVNGDNLGISVSLGVSQYTPNISVETFMNESDAALFEAKDRGKNQLHIYSPVSRHA